MTKERTEDETSMVPNESRKEEVTMTASEAATVWKAKSSCERVLESSTVEDGASTKPLAC